MVTREIVHPIFLQCLQYTDDLFWKMVFEEMSYNSCFSGTYITRGTYYCNIKSKEFSYKFQDAHPKDIFENISSLLKKHNIIGKSDTILFLKEYEDAKQSIDEVLGQEWSEIRKKNLKDLMFQNFLIRMKYEFELRDSQVKKLYSFINFCLLLKTMTNQSVLYKDGRIESIEGITFSKGKYHIDLELYALEDTTPSKKQDDNLKLLGNL